MSSQIASCILSLTSSVSFLVLHANLAAPSPSPTIKHLKTPVKEKNKPGVCRALKLNEVPGL